MAVERASDEVTDEIASIEMHRQEIERESGRAASCTYALPRLQEILQQEQGESQQGEDTPRVVNAANIEAVTAAINKVKSLAGGSGQRTSHKRPGPPPQGQRRHAPPGGERHRGRRNAGRRSGR